MRFPVNRLCLRLRAIGPLLLAVALACGCAVIVPAQVRKDRPDDDAQITGDGWELTTLQVDRVAVLGQSDPDQTIFVVSRRAPGESSSLAWRRLRSARAYMSEKGIPNTIVLADGEPVAGQGSINFYVGGKLVATILMGRKRDLSFSDG